MPLGVVTFELRRERQAGACRSENRGRSWRPGGQQVTPETGACRVPEDPERQWLRPGQREGACTQAGACSRGTAVWGPRCTWVSPHPRHRA